MAQKQEPSPAETIAAAAAQIDASWNALQAELATIPADRLLEPNAVGVWSVKDVMGHIAFWDGVAIDKINRAAGRPAPALEDDASWYGVNEREAAKRANHSLAEIRDELTHTHERLVSTLQSLSEVDPQVAAAISAGLPEDTDAHYAGHLDDIRQWRERTGRS